MTKAESIETLISVIKDLQERLDNQALALKYYQSDAYKESIVKELANE